MEIMENTKNKWIKSIIVAICCVLLGCTMFFGKQLELLLKFRPNLTAIEDGAFEVHFVDVGQGDACAIKFPNGKTMLVDSGPRNGRDNLDEYLEKVFFDDGYDTFDYVFLSHSDIDHSGNMKYILDKYTVKAFYRPYIYSSQLEQSASGFKVYNSTYDEILQTLKDKGITTFFSSNGGVIDTGAGTIKMYRSLDYSLDETNDFSPFLIVESQNHKVCLTGDATEEVEEEILGRNVLGEVDLFKLAHHGSKYSNSQELIDTLSPHYVVCSVGDNSYGHPTSDVLLRLAKFDEENNETTYDTFKTTLKDGNLIYYVNLDSEMNVLALRLGEYIFLDWYVVVIVGEIILIGYFALIILPKKPIKINKNLKNMKY